MTSEPSRPPSVNPYQPTLLVDAEEQSDSWPYLSFKVSRQVVELAKHADRAALSLVGAFFLGLIGPITFAIFFTVNWFRVRGLLRRHPGLLGIESTGEKDEKVARSFAAAATKFRRWACFFAAVLVLEVIWLLTSSMR